ncbi:DUF927 domain-containing protein [Streptomyces sp. FBKL.4005]|uniref:DUF927 domain-containing protein n=1 Tax=Streptomyces sp. FBKL.4005 TaxID=2015515 RepID=UPI0011810E41|nr:DUF927 domain-containing protein [Streptomyces sp. FBKL.4005]
MEREGSPVGARPIAGLKAGWFYRPVDRMLLHRTTKDAPALAVGTVPVVLGRITYRMSDRRHTRIAYQLQSEEGPRIVSAEEVLDGTWADRLGMRRPTTPDERHAYARILGEDVMEAGEVPALPVKDPDGGLHLPDVDAQELGYLRVREPDQEAAREGWRRVMGLASQSPRTTLVLSAMFAGPLVSSLHGVPAHILNLTGSGQIGKSTTQRIMCALVGDPTDAYELFGSMNSTGLALPAVLIEARYLPMCREETSSSALSLPELEKLFSRIVAGGKRARLGQGGKLKQGAGTWHSVFVTSSNESLLRPGQVESLASRLLQMEGPFFASASASAEAWQLAAQFHGWPLVWARDTGMFGADRISAWRELHAEIVARLTTEEARKQGGIPLTLARIMGAWCVGAYMLGELLGMAELGSMAEEDARRELPRILGDVVEHHLTPGQILWEKVAGAIAQEPAAWVQSTALVPDTWASLEYKPRRVLGYYHQGRVHVYVATLAEVTKAAGIDSPVPGLNELERRGVLIKTESAKLASKHPTKELRAAVPGRAYIFDPKAAQEAFADREAPPDITPAAPVVPGDDSATAASERRAMEAFRAPVSAAQAEDVDVVASRAHDITRTIQAPPRPTPPPRIAFPEAAEPVTDRTFASLAARATGRTLSATRFGVLGDGVLHLPNREPVKVAMPGSVDDVPALMAAYGLKTVWIHADALAPLGLPTYEERRELGAAQERAAKGLGADEPVKTPGSMTPVAHPWAAPGVGSPVLAVAPEGLTAWMTLKLADTASGSDRRLSVAIPAYEGRFDKAKQPGRGGFGGAPTPEVLLDALMAWTLSTLHGTQERPKVIPYYLSPNRTGEDFAGGRGRDDVLCRAVRDKAVPPALGVRLCPLMVPQQWHRDPSEAERAASWLHRYDKTAAWLAAYGPTKLGIGEPTHGGEGTPYNRAMAGFWRVADVPGTGLVGLPELHFRETEEGGYWLTTPSVELLRELYPDWLPKVLESWHWETSKAALSGMYKLMSTSRNRIVAAAEEGRPGAKWAKQVNGRIYQSFRGYLARAAGPQSDFTTGGDYQQDLYYRPDWAAMLISHATANMYRNLMRFAREDGRYPLSVYVDAVTFASDSADPMAAKPASMVIGNRGGTWSIEGAAPMAELLPILDERENRHGAHSALDQYLSDRGE